MALPAPQLDDRRFQDLVDDAKRLVQQRCPEWTDHNVSDPGVTLIETFAFMVDQLLYRLNRVPALDYLKFLDLIGVRLFPPTAAEADVTFWLSAPQAEPVLVPLGTEVATLRTESSEAIVFATSEALGIVPCSLSALRSTIGAGQSREHLSALESEQSFFCFDGVPNVDDALLVGLSEPVPRCAVVLRVDCEIEGIGVDPRQPPLAWEAWDGGGWIGCEIDLDETGGFNRPGDIVLHVPSRHTASVLGNERAGWLRCRVTESEPGQPRYSASPKINRFAAHTIGGTIECVNHEVFEDELLGVSEGVPGQRFSLQHGPVVGGTDPTALDVAAGAGWEPWTQVETFAESMVEDHHFVLDTFNGVVELGPAVREPDGSLRNYGAVAPKGARLRLRRYSTGGGRRGNVARGAINILKSSVPYVARVGNRRPASGGVDGESLESAKLRGPILLRTRGRAVTVADYEALAQEAAPEVARVRCVPAGDGADGRSVRVLVVPSVANEERGAVPFERLRPREETLARIAAYLDERRVLGARIVVEPPVYQGLTVVARLRARAHVSGPRLQHDAVVALNRYFHPISGGPDGTGWPFGRPIVAGEIFGVLQRVDGVELVEEARLFGADPVTGERGSSTARIDVDANALVFSYQHQVLVQEQ